MKPTPKITSNPRSSRSDSRALDEQRNFPVIDHSYQTSVETCSATSTATAKELRNPRELHAFRNISNEFFGSEATIEYIAEAAFFAWITCIAAWPIGVAIYQLMRWTI